MRSASQSGIIENQWSPVGRHILMNKQWVLTQQDFDDLLAWLDPDRERAGMKYEEIRQSLINIFTWRGCREADELADETINRVTQKIQTLADTYVGDPALYFYGVAKIVILEYRRRKPPPVIPPAVEKPDNYELLYECLDLCLRRLPADQRELILPYYEKEKKAKIDFRKEQARRLEIEPNLLRVRVFRIRAAVQKCIEACLEQHKKSNKTGSTMKQNR